MGSAASKTARKGPPRRFPTRAAGAQPAQGLPRAPPAAPVAPLNAAESSASGQPPAVDTGDKDADFASRLRQMGVVQPNPTFSPSSTAGGRMAAAAAAPPRPSSDVSGHDADLLRQIQEHRAQFGGPSSSLSSSSSVVPPARQNTTLSVLDARRRIQDQADAEEEPTASGGGPRRREFISALTIRDILVLRARGVDAATIEARLKLKPGVVARLGPPGLVEALNVAEGAAKPDAQPDARPTKA